MDKLYVVRKYVMAESAEQAIKKEVKHPVHDVWLDDDWFKELKSQPDNAKVLKGF